MEATRIARNTGQFVRTAAVDSVPKTARFENARRNSDREHARVESDKSTERAGPGRRAGLRLESSPSDLIRDYLLQRVEHGNVRNRHEVVDALHEAGRGARG